jgi:hypothetical protein
MKKLMLSVMMVAFAVAVQAGEGTCADKEKAGCCPAKAEANAKAGKDAKAAGAEKAAKDTKQALNSPKAK